MESLLAQHLIGISPAISKLRKLVIKIADINSHVLILGPSGSGKTLIASLIHQLSERKHKAFVPVNCGAIPSELLESELFGHEKGAFTGACNRRIGRFELADEGTLFLDEIGDMPQAMQVKLLRVIQENQFERIGSNLSLKVNVRLITATHQNLEQAIAAQKFREDLYYRLNVLPLEMPALKDRSEDIPILIEHFQEIIRKRLNRQVIFSPLALDILQQYDWPGNIRELANFVERMTVLSTKDSVDAEDLEARYSSSSSLSKPLFTNYFVPAELSKPFNLKNYMASIEKELIENALVHSHGIVSRAAKSLGIGRTTLIEKIRKYSVAVVSSEGDVIIE